MHSTHKQENPPQLWEPWRVLVLLFEISKRLEIWHGP